MLTVFTRDYNESSKASGARTYSEALSRICEEINQTCLSYSIIHVDHTRVTEFGDAEIGERKYYLESPYGTVTVLAEVEKKEENPLSAAFK